MLLWTVKKKNSKLTRKSDVPFTARFVTPQKPSGMWSLGGAVRSLLGKGGCGFASGRQSQKQCVWGGIYFFKCKKVKPLPCFFKQVSELLLLLQQHPGTDFCSAGRKRWAKGPQRNKTIYKLFCALPSQRHSHSQHSEGGSRVKGELSHAAVIFWDETYREERFLGATGILAATMD